MNIKVLTVRQPFSNWIMGGLKSLEVRSWRTKYRGRVYIHSAKSCDYPGGKFFLCGYILGHVDLVDIRKYQPEDIAGSRIAYLENRFAWVLENPNRIDPIPLKGQLGIFNAKISNN